MYKKYLSRSVAGIYEDNFNAEAYNRRQDFCQNLCKVQIFHRYRIDAFRLLPASNHSIIARFSDF